jgi:nucleoid DNA-binding protein
MDRKAKTGLKLHTGDRSKITEDYLFTFRTDMI